MSASQTALVTLETWLETQPRSVPPSMNELSVGRLNVCLSSGLSQAAVSRLEELGAAGDRLAGVTLGRYFARKGMYAEAAALLLEARTQREPIEDALLLTHCLIRSGQEDSAMSRQELMTRFGPTSDVLLSCANFALPDAQAYVGHLNQIYRRSGLVELLAPEKGGRLCLGRMKGRTAAPMNDPDNCVSVLMPAFNAERTLAPALDSLIAQSWRNLEIIIVDDCSSDATVSIAEEYARRDPRVVVLRHEKNAGAYPARNTALKCASGRLVTVHDSDDWSHPQKIEIQVRHALSTGAPIVASAAVRVQEDMSINFRVPQGTHLLTSFPSFMIERQLALDIGGWDCVRMGADAEMYSRIATMLGVKLSDPMPETPLSFMLSSPDSLTGQRLTGLDSVSYGARKQYIDAYRHWHASLGAAPRECFYIDPQRRPFPAPGVFFHRESHVDADEAYVFDFCDAELSDMLEAIDAAHSAGRKVALVHWPQARKDLTNVTNGALLGLIARHSLAVVTPGEALTARAVFFSSVEHVQRLPDALPSISAGEFKYLL